MEELFRILAWHEKNVATAIRNRDTVMHIINSNADDSLQIILQVILEDNLGIPK